MRLLLIEANQAERWIGARVGQSMHVVPIALLGLAAYVRWALPDTEVRVVESSLDVPTDDQLAALLAEFRPQWVGVRSINLFEPELRRIARVVRASSSALLVVGGPIATTLGRELLVRIPELDLVAVGEGEESLRQLIAGEAPAKIPGLWLRCPDTPVNTGEASYPRELDRLPFPDYSLVDLDAYARQLSYAYNQRRQGVLLTSRGCPYRCSYCFQTSQAPVRKRSAASIAAEIFDLVQTQGVLDFYVVDDLFNLSRARVLELCSLLIEAELGVRLYFVNGLRVDGCDRKLLDRMVEAGTVWVTFGIETAHPRLAELIRKPIDLVHARTVIAHAQGLGIAVNVDTMFGFPTETPEEARVTLDWLATLPHPSLLPYHFNLRGYSGCEIVEQAVQAGWDRDAFLSTGSLSYHDLPLGTPTFSRQAMLAHLIEYHERFGLSNRAHVAWSIKRLRSIGYSERELTSMYSVLLNRRVASLADLTDTR
jgi:radical SAM superfamily enzyme YgiQ (UPF0313 family)